MIVPASAQTKRRAPAPAPVPGGGLQKIERAWLDAWTQGDLKALNLLLSPDFTSTSSDGVINNREEWLAALKEGNRRVESITCEDFRARHSGTTAVVTGTAKLAGPGQRRGENSYTEVWVRRGVRWQLASCRFIRERHGEPGCAERAAGSNDHCSGRGKGEPPLGPCGATRSRGVGDAGAALAAAKLD